MYTTTAEFRLFSFSNVVFALLLSIGKMDNKRSAEGATAGTNAVPGEEESHLLKEARSSSLKTEMYRQIWQRRVLWFGQTLPSFESRSTIEFWSGWTNRSNGQQQAASGGNGNGNGSSKPTATTPPASSTSRRKKYQ